MQKYIDFILTSIIEDAQGFDHWYMYLIIPAIFYFIFLVLKYMLLTMPFWLPLSIIVSAFNRTKDNEVQDKKL